MSIVSQVNYFFGKPGHEFWLVFRGRVTIVSDRNFYKMIDEAGDFMGLVYKAPATGWGGMVQLPNGEGMNYVPDQGMDRRKAISEVRKVAKQVKAEHERYLTDPAYALEKELSRRDWYSHFSDDHRYWAAGERQDQVIKALIPKVDPELVKALWEKYAPKEVSCPA